MNYVKEYYRQIESGNTTACEEIRTIYARLVKEIDEPPVNFPFYFNEDAGNHPIMFIETFCRHYQGEHAGELVKLELFQKAFIQALFGFLEIDTNRRRFREYFLKLQENMASHF